MTPLFDAEFQLIADLFEDLKRVEPDNPRIPELRARILHLMRAVAGSLDPVVDLSPPPSPERVFRIPDFGAER